MKKTVKKIACGVLAAVSAFGCAATLSGCKTDHPEAEIKIEFQGETYTLDYKLYRKVAPATVRHFMYLADNGYYDGLCVHDYDTTMKRMYTGAYSVDASVDATELIYKRYYDTVLSYDNINKFPHSVWADGAMEEPTYTLKGEFKNEDGNSFRVESGALQETFGSLTMYYHNINNTAVKDKEVLTIREDGDKENQNWWKYDYNHATSMFFISMSNTAKTNNDYCTFATLKSGSKDDLEDLQAAIAEYIEDNHDNDAAGFTKQTSQTIFEDEKWLASASSQIQAYSVPKAPIIIKRVKITKY